MTALQCITLLHTATTSRAILQGGRNSAKKRIWVYEPEKKNIYGHLQFNLILVIKRLGHGVGRVDEYGSNGTEYRASETLIKATDKDGPEGVDENGVSSAPFGLEAMQHRQKIPLKDMPLLTPAEPADVQPLATIVPNRVDYCYCGSGLTGR